MLQEINKDIDSYNDYSKTNVHYTVTNLQVECFKVFFTFKILLFIILFYISI